MIKGFAEFILRNRHYAILVAVLTFLLPLVAWISSVVIALVTLRHGWREGLWVVLSLAVVLVIVLVVSGWMPINFAPFMLAGPVLAWGLAGILRTHRSWASVLVVAFYSGCLLVMFVLAMGHQPSAITGALAQYLSDNPELEWVVNWFMTYFIGLQVALLLLSGLISLALARAMQAMLFNPGGLYSELIQIRLPKHTALVTVLVLGMALFDVSWVKHLVPVVSLIYFLAGLSVLHFAVRLLRKTWPWLVGFYGFLLLFFIYIFMAVAALGVVDTWMNVRRQLSMRQSQ